MEKIDHYTLMTVIPSLFIVLLITVVMAYGLFKMLRPPVNIDSDTVKINKEENKE